MSAVHREFVESQATAAPRTCHELGVCNHRPGCTCHRDKPAAPSASAPAPQVLIFAPGVIEGGSAQRRRPWVSAARWVWRLVSVVCVLIVLLGLWGLVTDGQRPMRSQTAARVTT